METGRLSGPTGPSPGRIPPAGAAPGGEKRVLPSQLERSFRMVAFLNRVPLAHLSLIHPEAERCAGKEELLRPHVETLRALIRLGLEHSPSEVDRLVREFPDVERLLGGSGGLIRPAGTGKNA